MRKRRAILAMTLASAMLLSACGSQESSSSSAAASTKNADGKYDPVLNITIAKQLDENAGRYGDGEDINKNHGNGQKDTYGFTYAGDSIYNTGWVSDPVTLFSANSGKNIPGMWQEDANGDLVYGSICEGNKETLKRMSEWHANGWIFQEAAATGAWDAMMQFTEGKAGIFIGRPWAISSVRDVTTVDPDAVIAAYPTILQDNGECTYQTAQTNDGWLMFNKDFNNMEAFFTYYDWLYDLAFGTGDFQYGYLENYDYDIVNDEVVFDSASFDPAVTDPFVPSKSTVLKNAPFIDNMQAYADAKAGKEPIEAFDEFVEEWKAQGGEQITQEVNEWYKTVK